MNNNQEQSVPKNETSTMTPPPFRQSEEPQEQEPAASPTLADRIAALGVDEETANQICHLTHEMSEESINDELLATLVRGITHDDDVQNADAAGYLRGRNEKIDTVMHPQPQDEDETDCTPVFPRYCRRSIWD